MAEHATESEARLNSAIVLVAASADLADTLNLALASADVTLLHARSKEEAVAMLERVKSRFELAIIDLGLPKIDGWDLIRLLTRPPRRVMKTLVATFGHTEGFARQIRALGVDVVAPRGMGLNEWRTAVEEALLR